MSIKVIEIEGIGPSFSAKLESSGINTVEALLSQGKSKSGRQKLAQTTGVDESKILRWVNMADLFRIKGVGEEFADLLEAAGVDTVKELKTRKADNLHARMVEVNEKKKLVRQMPGVATVRNWIDQANFLSPIVTY